VLDLRSDPGGYLDQAVKICDMFIKSGVIVSTRRRHDHIFRVFNAKEEGTLKDFPMVILVDKYTASASEILAACLQDHKRAIVVGERTFGKGTIQELIGLESRRGMLKLTTGTYWRPSEKDINRRKGDDEDDDWGVQPDKGFEVASPEIPHESEEDSQEDAKKDDKQKVKPDDPQLEKALEYLRSKLGGKS
ncbi:MAG: peptidase S41, partial [Pirellulales bacterium]|nr:peptidase S41 [Pirellulales bacterium]